MVLPREVALHLRGGRVHEAAEPELPALATSPVDPDHVDRAAAGAAAETVRLVEELLELWSAEPPKVLRTGGVGVRERTRAAGELDVDESRLALLVETAHAAGLLAAGEDVDEVWLPTPAYDGWLDEPVADRWLVLAKAWLASTRVPGLVGGRDQRGRTLSPLGPDLDRTVAPAVRAAVLADLAELPVGTATTTESLSARLRWQAPRRGGRLQDDLVTWTVEEARALGLATGGALAGARPAARRGRRPGRGHRAGGRSAAAAGPRAAAGRPHRRRARPVGGGAGPVAAAGRRRRVDRRRDGLPVHRVDACGAPSTPAGRRATCPACSPGTPAPRCRSR